jgi:hypothetical protein
MPVTRTKSRWISGNLFFLAPAGEASPHHNIRKRFTTAQVNAGAEILPAAAGVAYRMTEVKVVAVGGAAAAVTTVDILGTQATSVVKLAAFAQASLTQSTELRAGDTGGTILADGASYAVCDAGAALTIGITGSAMTTATHIDVILEFAAEG